MFGARDVWFVVALPVYLSQTFTWDHWWVGGFLAAWVILYGLIQSLSPKITGVGKNTRANKSEPNYEQMAWRWALLLLAVPTGMAFGFSVVEQPLIIIIAGLLAYAMVFALNSSVHSFLIVHYAESDGVSLDVGFYYMANAMGRLLGTLLSGWVYQMFGLVACLLISGVMIALCLICTRQLIGAQLKNRAAC